jgi:glycerate kinase
MSLNILILPDKFKGTITARAAAVAIAKGWLERRPGDEVTLLPMSDGGDGFGDVLGSLLKAKAQSVNTVDAAGRHCTVNWWWKAKSRTAVIESAAVIGLAMLPPGKFHPSALDTFGLGAVIRAASAKGARRCLMGIGGSATNDGGFGVARSLDWKFLDRHGRPIEQWMGLDKLAGIQRPRRWRWFKELRVAVDVQNVMLGKRGSSRIYGPQKGLLSQDFKRAEECLGRLARVVKEELGINCQKMPGSGAAGGLGFGLAAFLGARLENGFNLFRQHAALERQLKQADLVVTGEGAIDESTLMGKGVGQITAQCDRLGIPCIGLAGHVDLCTRRPIFASTHALTSLTTLAKARAETAYWLERLAEKAAGNGIIRGFERLKLDLRPD